MPPKKGRREKKNKYASFSKTSDAAEDPFDSLVTESETKMREMKLKKALKSNVAVPLNEVELEAMKHEKRERNKRNFPDTSGIDPYDPTTYGYVELGTVIGPHGVKGEVKLSAVTDFAEARLCRAGRRHIRPPNRRSPREIELITGRRVGTGEEYLLRFRDVGDRESATKLRGCILYALEDERVDELLDDDEYLVTDLVGADVMLDLDQVDDAESGVEEKDSKGAEEGKKDDEKEQFVGTVSGVVLGSDMCAVPGLGQDMLEVVLPRGDIHGLPSWKDEMVLIPFVPQIVTRVDLKGRTVYITPPAGLLDLTYVRQEKVRIKGLLPPAKD